MLTRALDSLRACSHKPLVCRDTERKEILSRLRGAICQGGSTQILYVSGMPGTGKTASLTEAVARLRAEGRRFSTVEVNAMRLGSPEAAFVELRRQLRLEGLMGKVSKEDRAQIACGNSAADHAYAEVAQFFSKRVKGDTPVLLFIDEIDQLVTLNHIMLYRIFNLLLLPRPGLVIAAISNIVDLPERLLPRISSRMSCARVDFKPYRADQLKKILVHRLTEGGATGAITDLALNICAGYVGRSNGDVRKALQVCRHAVALLLQGAAKGPVDDSHLQAAARELLHSTPATQVLAGLCDHARVVLLAAVVEQQRHPGKPFELRKVARRFERLLRRYRRQEEEEEAEEEDDDAADTTASVRYLLERLEAMRIVTSAPRTQPGAGSGEQGAACGPSYGFHGCLDEDDVAKALKKLMPGDRILDALDPE